MKITILPLVALGLSACGVDAIPSATIPATEPAIAQSPERYAVAAELPNELDCVSQPFALGASDKKDHVVRAHLTRDGESFTGQLATGPQFASHGGEQTEPMGEPEVLAFEVVDGTTLRDDRWPHEVITMELERDGVVLRGMLRRDQPHIILERSLTCWNATELWGSSPARYDWTKGDCVDAEGTPARNDIPLAVVQETGFGECTDLVGRLNGTDLSDPDLVAWNLSGANLDDASLTFAKLTNAMLFGARLGGLESGYAEVSGFIDEHTVLPAASTCATEARPFGDFVRCVH